MPGCRLELSVALCWLLIVVGGCLPRNPSVDMLHARLRQDEHQIAELQASLEASRTQLKQARREIDSLRTEIAERGLSNVPPEHAAALVKVARIEIQPWLSGGVEKDDNPGDDALAVHFVPRDDQGEIVKLPGSIKITLTDPAGEPNHQTVGTWTFTPEECREQWTRGLLGGGYQFTLPWDDSPVNSRLAVHVEYETPDGRTFQDTQLVKVNPMPEALAKRRQEKRPEPDDRSQDDAVRPASRLQTSRKPDVADESADGRDALQQPHSVNWTEETIPRLR